MKNSITQQFNVFSLIKFALPTIIMMVSMSLYTIVDGAFVSRIVGDNALTAINIVYPFINLVFGFGIMLATGGSAIVAKQIGENKENEARENFSLIALVSIIIGFIFLIIGLLFLEPICNLLGATPLILADCKKYLGILLLFSPISMLQMFFQVFFVTEGRPGLGLTLTLIGGVTNIVLDYLFMAIFNLGIIGAALATGIGQAIMVVVGIYYFFWQKKNLYFVKPILRLKILLNSCANGSSEMVSNLSMAIVTFLFNITMLHLLGEDGVAAITIVLYSQFLFTSLYLGFSMGVAPIFSFNYGNQNYSQLKRVYKICILFIVISSIFILLISLIFADPIVGLFVEPSSNTYQIAVFGFPIFSINYIFAGVNIFASSMFTAFSDGKTSAIISFCRTLVFIVISILLLPIWIGIIGVWLSVPLAELLTIFISILYFKNKKKKFNYI